MTSTLIFAIVINDRNYKANTITNKLGDFFKFSLKTFDKL